MSDLSPVAVAPDSVKDEYQFIYADKLDVGIAGALELMQLSRKYEVHPLTRRCEELLKTEIPIVDSVEVFETARRYGHQELMDRAGPIMVESFLEWARTDSLTSAEEGTLVYLLERDDLAVKEVELFQFILDWGKKQVQASADGGLLRDELENLISKIRYTNMTPYEFTKVVVPTGLLSAEEVISVYSYFCGDEIIRRDLNLKFNTTPRKMEAGTKILDFSTKWESMSNWFPAFRKHTFSFNADGKQVDEKVQPNYSRRKAVIAALHFDWPGVRAEDRILNFDVSVVEYSDPTNEPNSKFQKKSLNCPPGAMHEVSVEPPVELVPGRTYSVIVEDPSPFDSTDIFRGAKTAYLGGYTLNSNTYDEDVHLEDDRLILKDIHWNTDYYKPGLYTGSGELTLIAKITIRQM